MTLLTKADYERLTQETISRAFHQQIASSDANLAEQLGEIIADLVPGNEPGVVADRLLLLERVLAAVADDVTTGTFRIVPAICNCDEKEPHCQRTCAIGALRYDPDLKCYVDEAICIDCGQCIEACPSGAVVARTDCLRLVDMIRGREQGPIYAIIAPAFVGQFGPDVDDAQVKAAILSLGFDDIYEVAMAADIVTLLEAEEYVNRVDRGEQFVITSCCCPAFLKLVAKVEPASAHLVSDSVSPMIALGRLLKVQNPEARVVFIGPCLAKKAESYQEGLTDAIDGVLTFKEIASLLATAGLNVAAVEGETSLQDASHDGRIYAYTGGVSEAIIRAVQQLRPDLEPKTVRGNGIKQCREILQAVERGEIAGTFMEGMACVGGCLGGPGNIVREADEIAPLLRAHAQAATSFSAKENEKAKRLMQDYGQQTSFALQLPTSKRQRRCQE